MHTFSELTFARAVLRIFPDLDHLIIARLFSDISAPLLLGEMSQCFTLRTRERFIKSFQCLAYGLPFWSSINSEFDFLNFLDDWCLRMLLEEAMMRKERAAIFGNKNTQPNLTTTTVHSCICGKPKLNKSNYMSNWINHNQVLETSFKYVNGQHFVFQ